MASYTVEVLPRVERDLGCLPRSVQVRILRAMHALGGDPRPPGVVKLAGDENLWRVRVGQYRILYEIHDRRPLMLVVRVGHRGDVYRPK